MIETTGPERADTRMPIDSYGLVLPDPWRPVPLDPTGQRSMLDSAVETFAALDGWSATHRRRLEVSMVHYNASMAAMRASYAAAYLDLWPAEETGDEPLLVTANCAIGSLSARDLGVDMALTAPTLLIAASNEHVLSEQANHRVVGTTNLAPPEIVDLRAGPAVRIRRHQFVRTDLGSARGVFSETYLVPHTPTTTEGSGPSNPAGSRCCVLGFSTANDALTSDFSPLFARIAQTLRMHRKGDPTFVDANGLH